MSGWHERARALKAADPARSNASIARELGVTKGAVWKVLHPERASEMNRRQNRRRHEVKLEWQRQHDRSEAGRATCAECGELCGVASAKGGVRTCADCIARGRHERAEQIVAWWAEGLSMRDICERLGWAKGTLSSEIDRMRSDGYSVPHRYRTYAGRPLT